MYTFVARLRKNEKELLIEVQKAFRIMIAESMRNAMMATCRRLDLWPPEPRPAGVHVGDCSFKEIAAPMPVIAQRLYNDEARRHRRSTASGSGATQMGRRPQTASFIVDFACAAGVILPEMPQKCMDFHDEFESHAAEWEQAQSTNKNSDLVTTGFVTARWRDNMGQWWTRRDAMRQEVAEWMAKQWPKTSSENPLCAELW